MFLLDFLGCGDLVQDALAPNIAFFAFCDMVFVLRMRETGLIANRLLIVEASLRAPCVRLSSPCYST